jgi:RNA polymerase sigma-70 factor (ECF subfamily)
MTLEGLPAGAGVGSLADALRDHQAMVYSIALHSLRDRARAEDVAQEVFLRLSTRLGALQSPEHLVNWLRTVTSRLCIDEIRRHPAGRTLHLEAVGEPAAEAGEADPLLSAHLRRLVAGLPGPARLALILRYQEDLDPREIATLLDESVHTTKSRLQRGLATLRAGLERLGVTP